MTLEREVKLGVWPGFSLPELVDIADGVTVRSEPQRSLEATYYDTGDLRLARWGITLRHRTGEAIGDVWTLKLPKDSTGDALVREEIVVPGTPEEIPDEIRQHIAARARTATLRPVARLQTVRSTAVLAAADGKTLAEVVDDEVSVLDGLHLALRFREVEVELAPDADAAILDEVVARLRAAGAGAPDRTPKVIRALGPRALESPELVELDVDDDASAAELLRAGITRAVLRILDHDAGVRLTDDAEAVHQARVGTRRLRSDLRTFAPLLDERWLERLRAELRWYADLLGAVRDADVLLDRVVADLARLDEPDALAGQELVTRLHAQRSDARDALVSSMRTSRHAKLLDELVEAALDPRVASAAARPAREVVPRLVSRPWRSLEKAVRRADPDAPDEVLHEIRIRAKRARYAADVASLVVGTPARRFAEAMAALQDTRGAHQDACVRERWLRDAAPSLTPQAALVAGELVAMARGDATAQRTSWPSVWSRASKGRLRTWLTR